MTIASDDEIEPEEASDSEDELAAAAAAKPAALTKAGKKRQRQKAAAGAAGGKKGDGLVDPSFSFDVESSNLGIAETQAVKGWDFKSESPPSLLARLSSISPSLYRSLRVRCGCKIGGDRTNPLCCTAICSFLPFFLFRWLGDLLTQGWICFQNV